MEGEQKIQNYTDIKFVIDVDTFYLFYSTLSGWMSTIPSGWLLGGSSAACCLGWLFTFTFIHLVETFIRTYLLLSILLKLEYNGRPSSEKLKAKSVQ